MFLVFVSSGNMTQISGDMTSGEMTVGRLDCKPIRYKSRIQEFSWSLFKVLIYTYYRKQYGEWLSISSGNKTFLNSQASWYVGMIRPFRKLFWGFVRHKALKFPLDHGKHAHDRRCLSDSWSWVVVPEVDLWRTLLRTVGCEVHQTVIKTSKYGQNCKYYPHKSF